MLPAFSTIITFFPASAALIAEVNPAPPAPITTMSVSWFNSNFSSVTSFAFKSSGLIPADSKAFLTDSIKASEVNVAPDTASTSTEFDFTIVSANFSAAAPPIVGVSFSASIFTSLISLFSTVTIALTSPA